MSLIFIIGIDSCKLCDVLDPHVSLLDLLQLALLSVKLVFIFGSCILQLLMLPCYCMIVFSTTRSLYCIWCCITFLPHCLFLDPDQKKLVWRFFEHAACAEFLILSNHKKVGAKTVM